jgi:predicted RNA-binding Zn-ribbon protein involved in translation (DUF1610 family)
MNNIKSLLQSLNPLEIVLNYDKENNLDELSELFYQLSEQEQKDFMESCREQVEVIRKQYGKFYKLCKTKHYFLVGKNKKAEAQQEIRQKRIEQGLCPSCGKEMDREGYRCRVCLDKYNESKNRHKSK